MNAADPVVCPSRTEKPGAGVVLSTPAWLITLLACVIALVFFFPRLDCWLCLDFTIARNLPETSRALFEANRLANPWHVPPGDYSNRLAAWRLIPILPLHLLHAPLWALCALAWAGTPALALYAVRRCPVGTGAWKRLAMSLVVTTSSTALVTTGWLTYTDAWWVLGLCIAALSPSWRARAAAGLIFPLVDERFIIGLPLALLARHLYPPPGQDTRESLSRLLLPALATLPYLLLRSLAWHTPLNQGASALLATQKLSDMFYPEALGAGLWQGVRAVWLPCLLGLAWCPRGKLAGLALGAVMLATYGIGCFLADDFSRNTGMLLPVVVVLGVHACAREDRLLIRGFAIGALLNLPLPAWHQISVTSHPIYPAWEVLPTVDASRRALIVDTGAYMAEQFMSHGYHGVALRYLREAHAIAPANARVLRLSEMASRKAGWMDEAAYYSDAAGKLAAPTTPAPATASR